MQESVTTSSNDGHSASPQDVPPPENDTLPLTPNQSSRPPPSLSTSRWSSIVFPVQRVSQVIVDWIRGPRPAQLQKIRPWFPRVQTWPIRMLHRYLPKRRHRLALLLAFYFCWLLAFVSILHRSAFAGETEDAGRPVRLSCVASYWYVRAGIEAWWLTPTSALTPAQGGGGWMWSERQQLSALQR